MNPEISVLVPVYNVEKYIQKCAESLFNNTIAASCEFIFTNDASTDSSMDLLNQTISNFPELKNQIIIIQHKTNQGLGKTRNTGFDQARGKYIICVDSDDWVEPDYLEILLLKAKEKNADLVGCDSVFENEITKSNTIKTFPLSSDPDQLMYDLYTAKISSYLWIKLIKREFLLQNNIRWDDSISYLEDLLLCTKILIKKPIISYISKPLYHYLIRAGSYLHKLHTIKNAENIFNAINSVEEILKEYKNQKLIDAFMIRKYIFKYEIITKGTKQTQKKYLNLYPDLNIYMNKNNTKFFYRHIFIIHKHMPNLAFFFLVIFSTIKGILGRIDLKIYYTC